MMTIDHVFKAGLFRLFGSDDSKMLFKVCTDIFHEPKTPDRVRMI